MVIGNVETEERNQTTQELIKNTIKIVHGMEMQAEKLVGNEEAELDMLQTRARLIKDLPETIKEITTDPDSLSVDDLSILTQISMKAEKALNTPAEKNPQYVLSTFLITSREMKVGEPNLLEIFYNRVYSEEK